MQELLILIHLVMPAKFQSLSPPLKVLMRTLPKPTFSSQATNIPTPPTKTTRSTHPVHHANTTITIIIISISSSLNPTKTTFTNNLVSRDPSNTKTRPMPQIRGRSQSLHSRLKPRSSNLIQMSLHFNHQLKLPLRLRLSLPSSGMSSQKRLLDSQWPTLSLTPTISTFSLSPSSKPTPKSLSQCPQFQKSLPKISKLRRY